MKLGRRPQACRDLAFRGHRRLKRGQRGLTLIETIVTVAVLATGVVGIAAGVSATQRISGITQNQAQLEVSMRQFADWVRDSTTTTCTTAAGGCPNLPYALCASKTVYQTPNVANAISAGALTAAAGETLTITQVNLSTSGTRTPLGGAAVNVRPLAVTPSPPCSGAGTCPGAGCIGDWGAQEITVQVVSGANKLSRIVWKSNGW